VLVLHALTGDSHAAGPAEPGHPQAGWWSSLIGPGAPIDTDRFFVVAPNVLGGCQGTTGPGSDAPDGRRYGSRFPVVTPRDQVAVEVGLADALGVERFAAVVGGSMGAMRALEWAIGAPGRVGHAIVIAVGAAATAEQIALCSLQSRVIRADPDFAGGDYYELGDGLGPVRGMAIARGIGQVSYRSELELDERFGRRPQGDEQPLAGGRYAVESYIEHHGDRLDARFDADTYLVLSAAMNHHDIGRGRGGVGAALARIVADVTIAGIVSDRLYPLRLQQEIAAALPRPVDVDVVHSAVGHDGFLVEQDAIGKIVRRALTG
jgi:homoserine O-acetyltransferase